MKKINQFVVLVAALVFAAACNKIDYSKTKSGLLYKIYPSGSKDSLIKTGNIVKLNITMKLNDSVLYTSYGKAPAFLQVAPLEGVLPYNLLELLPKMKTGDSGITVQIADTLMKRGEQAQLPPNTNKNARLTTTFKIIRVFTSDSLARADYEKEMEKDRPRQLKEQEEQMAKMAKERQAQQEKEYQELVKSGEVTKQDAEVQAYLTKKGITNAKKAGQGTYVAMQQEGTGPQAAAGKFVSVKYTGRSLSTDSVFESSVIPALKLGENGVIRGWEEGLLAFKQGGKGTLFIPGYLAYGKNPGPGGKTFEALIFDIEMLSVSDTMPAMQAPARPQIKN